MTCRSVRNTSTFRDWSILVDDLHPDSFTSKNNDTESLFLVDTGGIVLD